MRGRLHHTSRAFPGAVSIIPVQAIWEPQYYYLLLVHHPARNLPAFVKDLVRLLNDTFETYFSNQDE